MNPPYNSQTLTDTLILAASDRVAGLLDASVPAMILSATDTSLRFLNSAAAHVLGVTHARPLIGHAPPVDDAVLRHLNRAVAALKVGDRSTERIRYYRGIRPIVVLFDLEHLGEIAGKTAVLATMAAIGRTDVDHSLEATLKLYIGADEWITVIDDAGVLAVAGEEAVIDATAGDVEMLVERAANLPVDSGTVRTGDGVRTIILVRLPDDPGPRRLLHIGPNQTAPAGSDRDASTIPQDIAPTGPAMVDATPDQTFVFMADPKPRRFAFELGPDHRFVTVGPQLAGTLGPAAAPKAAEDWTDLAQRLALDRDHRVAGLLNGRQPWHGHTVAWPVEGAALRVPVDLSVMPVTGADRQFAGFRGFGVIRTGAAEADPAETGLHLTGAPQVPAAEARPDEDAASALGQAEEPPLPEPRADTTPEAGTTSHIDPPDEIATSDPSQSPAPSIVDPRQPDVPFPRLVPPPAANTDDETLLSRPAHAHISPAMLRLSGSERNAFRQIAEALGARFEGDDDPVGIEPATHAGRSGADIDDPVHILPPRGLAHESKEPSQRPDADHRDGLGFPPSAGDTRLIDRLPIAVALTRDEGLLHANAAFLALTGYRTIEELTLAGGLGVLFAGPHAAKGWAEDRNRHHIPLVTKDGRVLPVDARIASVPWEGGTALLMSLIAADRPGGLVVDGDRADLNDRAAALDTRVQELEGVLAVASDGILTLAADGRITAANPQAEILFGVEPGTLAGRHLIDSLAPESHRAATDYLDGLARNGIGSLLAEGRELMGRGAGDRYIPLFVTIARSTVAGEPGFVAVMRDISRWKASEDELRLARRRAEEASLQKSDFLARISHEIRTPLNAIIGFSEVMLGERFGAIGVERYKDYLRDIQSSGTHIMSLVNDLLDLSKVESGKLELKFEAVQLTEILADCVQLMQPQANRERIIIRASLTHGLPLVVADVRSIRQIVLNLLSNAIKFTPPGGQVIVSAALEETNDVVIRVRDTGYGMSPNEIEIALEPFRQVHNGRNRATSLGSGTGLGLPLTKALVEANRAALKIDSAVNQGTLVQVTFPAPRVLAAE